MNDSIRDTVVSLGSDGSKGSLHSSLIPGKRHFVIVAGLGDRGGYDLEAFRRAYSSALVHAKSLNPSRVWVFLPEVVPDKESFEVPYVSELALYSFDQFRNEKSKNLIRDVTVVSDSGHDDGFELSRALAQGTIFTRDIANLPPSIGTPSLIEERVREIPNLKVSTLNREDFVKLGMGGVESVSRAATQPAKVLVMEYEGSNEKPVLLVGKGITFDSGGISIKPWQEMDQMKFDKCGAATVIGIMKLISSVGLKKHVVGITPLTENMPGGNAYKPGDIVKHYNGKTSEIISTDAEGRLVLADALAYGIEKFDPTSVIDFATLTGASIVALGKYMGGLFTNDDGMRERMMEASSGSWEKVWHLPLDDDFKDQIKSEVADIKNSGGRWGGSSTAAAFLSNFVDSRPWAHIDFPGVAYVWDSDRRLGYLPLGSTGFGVRMIYNYLRSLI